LPVVVELGTGSGAVAKSIATELTGTRVHAVEMSEEAAAYARATWRTRPSSSTCGT
jgi:release factor glutamine methyltransferase